MARREWPLHFRCGHDGCAETVRYAYPTLRDLNTSFELKNYGNGKWRCLRHSSSDRVLSAANPSTQAELTVEQKEHGKYFGSWGTLTGPGFVAFAQDFPAGTKVIITATLQLPTDAPTTAQEGRDV